MMPGSYVVRSSMFCAAGALPVSGELMLRAALEKLCPINLIPICPMYEVSSAQLAPKPS